MADFVGVDDVGFIYVSFGSFADIGTAPPEFQNIFYQAFAKANVRFLWKRPGKRPKEMPGNVLTGDWMPQKDILGKPLPAFKFMACGWLKIW